MENVKKLTGVLIDVKREIAKKMTITDNLETLYRHLNCSTIDITYRNIGGKEFLIICDDEGLFHENPKISAIDKDFQPQLVGNLFVISNKDDGEGNFVSLTDEECDYVKKHIRYLGTKVYPGPYPMLVIA